MDRDMTDQVAPSTDDCRLDLTMEEVMLDLDPGWALGLSGNAGDE